MNTMIIEVTAASSDLSKFIFLLANVKSMIGLLRIVKKDMTTYLAKCNIIRSNSSLFAVGNFCINSYIVVCISSSFSRSK